MNLVKVDNNKIIKYLTEILKTGPELWQKYRGDLGGYLFNDSNKNINIILRKSPWHQEVKISMKFIDKNDSVYFLDGIYEYEFPEKIAKLAEKIYYKILEFEEIRKSEQYYQKRLGILDILEKKVMEN